MYEDTFFLVPNKKYGIIVFTTDRISTQIPKQ